MLKTIALIVLCTLANATATADDDWPQFRGPASAGVATMPLPVTWDANTNILWSAEVPGRGWSSPVVVGDKVFVTAVFNDKTPAPRPGLYIQDLIGKIPPGDCVWKVYCIDFNTGKSLWDKVVFQGKPTGPIHLKNTYASETPVADGELVFAYFGNLGLYCYDMKGTLVWQQNQPTSRTRLGWGTAASPVLYKDRVYLVNDNEDKSYIVAYDKKTGKEVWKVERQERSNWATPFIWENKQRTEIVTAGSDRVRSYDLDGKLMWEFRGMSVIAIPTPFAGPDLVYVTSGYILDPHRPLYAIKPGASGDISLQGKETSNASIAWCQKLAGPYHPTPVLYEGNLYVLLDKGFLACYDAATGKEVYAKQRIDPQSDKFTASPWAADGKIYCLSEDGDTYVIGAGSKFEVLGKNSLGEMCLATPALVRGNIVLRSASKLYRIGAAK